MFGQLVALNLLFLFNPFLPGVTWHPVAFLIRSHSNSRCCFRSSFHAWVSELVCTTPAVADRDAVSSGASFSASLTHLPMSQSLLLLSGDVEQPQVSKPLQACSIWIVAILPEGTQGRQGANICFFLLSFALSVEEVCSWQGTVHRLDWYGHGAEWPKPTTRVLGNTRQLWRTKWMARVEDKNWLHGLVAYNFLVLSLPHPSSLLWEMSHLLPPSQAVRANLSSFFLPCSPTLSIHLSHYHTMAISRDSVMF